eukprot:168268-Pyramimonas_sp.AAC.1
MRPLAPPRAVAAEVNCRFFAVRRGSQFTQSWDLPHHTTVGIFREPRDMIPIEDSNQSEGRLHQPVASSQSTM